MSWILAVPVGRLSPDGAQIKVVNADLTGGVKRQWTVPRARHLSCDRQGDVWVLQQRTGISRRGWLDTRRPARS